MARIAPLVLAALMVLVVLLIRPASGDDVSLDGDINNESRQLYVDKDTFFASISSFSEAGGAPWFKFSLDAHDELGIKASYGYNDRTRDYVGMDLKFIALIEYFDTNGNGIYEDKDERMASFYPLSISAYSTDFINKEREWNETKVDEETQIIQNGTWEVDYSEFYQMGFLRGWKLGTDAGARDRTSSLPFQPDPAQRIPAEVEMVKASFDLELSSKNAYPQEVRDWLLKGALNAFYAGFKHGYTQEYYYKPTTNTDAETAPKDEIALPTAEESSSDTEDKTTASGTDPTASSSSDASANMSDQKDQEVAPTVTSDPSVSNVSSANGTSKDARASPTATTSSPDTDAASNGSKSDPMVGTEPAGPSTSATSGTRGGDYTVEPVTKVRPGQNIVAKYRPLNITKAGQGDVDRIMLETWDNNGYFGIRCVVSNAFSVIGNGYLSPASIKIDLMIGKFPYRFNETKIALLMEMGSDIKYAGKVDMERKVESYDQKIGLASDEEEMSFNAADFSGFLSWFKDAVVDGVEAPVRSRLLASVYGKYWEDQGGNSENHRGVLFCYPRAERIVHDNKLGFVEIEEVNVYTERFPVNPIPADARTIIGNPALYLGGIAAVVLLVASTWKRRGPPR